MKEDVADRANVLIVDDNYYNRKLLEVILGIDNHKTFAASNGLEALSLVHKEDIDLVLLDIMMPGMAGFEVCQRLKEDKQTSHIPVIFISAKDDQNSLVRGFEMGAYDYFTKPINQTEIQVKINNCLNATRAERRLHKEQDLRRNTESIIRLIANRTANTTGIPFFYSLLKHTSKILDVDFAFVGEVEEDMPGLIRTSAVYAREREVENFEYRLQGTPTAKVMEEDLCVFTSGIQEYFPEDQMLKDIGADSYIGITLTDREHKALGILVMVDNKPIEDPEYFKIILQAISLRAAAELERNRDQENLARTKARLDLAVEVSGVGVTEFSMPLDKNTYISEQWANILGYTIEEIPGSEEFLEWFLNQIHPDEQEDYRREVNEFIGGKREKFEMQFRIRDKTGEWIYVHARSVATNRNEGGKVTRLIGTLQDKTRDHLVQQAILQESGINKAMSELAANLIDPSNSMQDITNITLDMARELTGAREGMISVIEPESGDNVCYTLTDLMGSGKMMPKEKPISFKRNTDGTYNGLIGHALNTNKAFYTNDVLNHPASDGSLQKAHGGIHQFLAVPAKLGSRMVGEICLANPDREFNDGDLQVVSRLTKLFGVAVYRKDMEDALKQSEERFRILFDFAPDIYYLHDMDGKMVDGNRAAMNLVGYEKRELVGKNLIRKGILAKEYRTTMSKVLKYSREGRSAGPYDLSIRAKDGKLRILEIRTLPMIVEGEQLVLGIARDITDRREMERRIMNAIMETEEKERQRFAQDLHDGLGPLLSTAKLYIRSLDTLEDPEKKAFAFEKSMEVIDEAISSLRELANNISPHILKNFGLEAALRSFVKQMNGTGHVDISMIGNLEERPREQVEVNLFRVLVEMLHNSLKHSEAERIRISLEQHDSEIRVHYSDDGKGMDMEMVLGEGSGHGVRNIVNRVSSIKGKVDFVTAPDEGFSARIVVNMNES